MGRTVPDHPSDVAKLILDELLADPRAQGLLDLVDAATAVVRALQPGDREDEQARELRRQFAEFKAQANVSKARHALLFASSETLTRESIRQRRSGLAALCHPDHGGSNEAMARINAAAEALLAEVEEQR